MTLQPRTVRVTLATSPVGLRVVYSGETGSAPMTRTAIVGSKRTVHAPSPQEGAAFRSWSDGGAQQHDVTIGTSDATYTATFEDESCSPRPPVRMTTAPKGRGVLEVELTAQTGDGTPSNALVSVRVTAVDNARAELDGRAVAAGEVARLPAGTQRATLVVRRGAPAAASTVRLVVTDACGPWETFVGGGPTAF